jgi:hypothetical protein
MIRSRRFVALQLLALLLQLALAGTVYHVVAGARAETAAAQARATEIAVRAAGVREYEFHRGVYAMCLAAYGDVAGCNRIVAGAVEHGVYGNAVYSQGFEPAR